MGDNTSQVIENAFNTSPDTVYGVLVMVLVVACGALAYSGYKLIKSHKQEIVEIVTEHKREMKEIYEKYERKEEEKYNDMKALTEKVMVGMESMTNMIKAVIGK